MRRLTAIFALVVAAATLALAIAVAINQFPRGLALLGCVLVAGASAWYGLRRRGIARVVGVIVAGIALVGAIPAPVAGRRNASSSPRRLGNVGSSRSS